MTREDRLAAAEEYRVEMTSGQGFGIRLPRAIKKVYDCLLN